MYVSLARIYRIQTWDGSVFIRIPVFDSAFEPSGFGVKCENPLYLVCHYTDLRDFHRLWSMEECFFLSSCHLRYYH